MHEVGYEASYICHMLKVYILAHVVVAVSKFVHTNVPVCLVALVVVYNVHHICWQPNASHQNLL